MITNERYKSLKGQITTNYAKIVSIEHEITPLEMDVALFSNQLERLVNSEQVTQVELEKINYDLETCRMKIRNYSSDIDYLIKENKELISEFAELHSIRCGEDISPDYYSIKIEDLGLSERAYDGLTHSHWYWHWDEKHEKAENYKCVGDVIRHMIEETFGYHERGWGSHRDELDFQFEHASIFLDEDELAEVCLKLEEFGYHHENIDIILKRNDIWHLGLNDKLVKRLINAGLYTKAQLAETCDGELLDIPRIGQAKVAQIREAIQQ